MTKEQQESIDACKDQAAKEIDNRLSGGKYRDFDHVLFSATVAETIRAIDRAMQLYGEQCRKEAIKDKDFILSSIETALSVGEIHFEACALSKGAKKKLLEAKEKLTAQA